MPQLLAEADQQRVDPRGIDVGQLGQVADAHHQRGLGIAAADLEVAAERGREAEADRLEDRVDPERDAPALEGLDRLVEPVERPRPVGDGDDLDAPVGGPRRGWSRSRSGRGRPPPRRPAATSTGSKLSIETRWPRSRKAATASPTPAQGPPGSQPRSIRSAPSSREPLGHGRAARPGSSRGAWLISARISMSKPP